MVVQILVHISSCKISFCVSVSPYSHIEMNHSALGKNGIKLILERRLDSAWKMKLCYVDVRSSVYSAGFVTQSEFYEAWT
jgi:hypothetical protein